MRKENLIVTCALALAIASGSALAQDAESDEQYTQRHDRGDRIERRLDRSGDTADRRLDRAARRARDAGHDRVAPRLDRRGGAINRHLDRKGRQIDRRRDRRQGRE